MEHQMASVAEQFDEDIDIRHPSNFFQTP